MKQKDYTTLNDYMNVLFGSGTDIQRYEMTDTMPLYLSDGYNFLLITLQDISFIAMEPLSQEYRLPTVVSHLAKASQITQLHCALLFSSLRSQQRNALIQQKIPFVVPGAQLYLPFAACMFTERLCINHPLPEAMAPGTQLVFLYLYYQHFDSAVTATELAETLQLSKATLTRAIYSLQQIGLVSVQNEGTKKLLTLTTNSRTELLQAAKPYLQSPVFKTIYLSKKPEKALLGGILALSSLTMLSPNSLDGAYVVPKREARHLKSQKMDRQDFLDFGGYAVEVWNYDPTLLATDKTVDDISLLLSFTGEYDERTEQALEILKERVSW